MSVGAYHQSPHMQFSNRVMETDENLFTFTNKLPKDGMKKYEFDEKTGDFVLTYDQAYERPVSHSLPKWEKTLDGVKLKVDKVVRGKIIPATENSPARLEFKSGIKAVYGLNASLVSVEADPENRSVKMTGKVLFVKQTIPLGEDDINLLQVDWSSKK